MVLTLVQRLLNISAVCRKCGPVLSFLSNSLTEQLDEAALTVGFVVLLFESAFVELFQAEGTDEVLRVELLGHGCDAAARDGLLTAGAEGAAPLVVVHLAVRLAVVLEEAAVHKRGEAVSANETLRMPKTVEGGDVVLQDGSGAAAAFRCKHVKVILPAVGFSVFFVETLWAEEGATLSAEEVFRMPRPVQRRHNFVQYGPVAVVASWGEQVVVIFLAVRLSFPLKEVPGAYLLLTVCTHKVLGVPRTAHGGHHLSHDWLTAGTTDSFSNSLHPQLVEVRLQAAEHVVQLVDLCRRPTWNASLPLGHNLEVRQRGHQFVQLSGGTGSRHSCLLLR